MEVQRAAVWRTVWTCFDSYGFSGGDQIDAVPEPASWALLVTGFA
jgi:hypothetical protein